MRLEEKMTVRTVIKNLLFKYMSNRSSKEGLAGTQTLAQCNLLTRKGRYPLKKINSLSR